MDSGKKLKKPSDVINDAGEGDVTEAENPPSTKDQYDQGKYDSEHKDFAQLDGFLF